MIAVNDVSRSALTLTRTFFPFHLHNTLTHSPISSSIQSTTLPLYQLIQLNQPIHIITITMGLLGTSDPVKKEEKLIEKGKFYISTPSEYQLTV